MQLDSQNVEFSVWSNAWISPSTIIALLAFLFVLYKYRQLRKLSIPYFTYLTHITDSDGEHFVTILASSFSGAIPHPKFFVAKLVLGIIPTKKYFLNSILKVHSDDSVRLDSEVPRTTFKEEQLFWLLPNESFKFSKGKYKIYGKTKVGNCSIVYHRDF